MNLHVLEGRLGADPEVRFTSKGTAVCTMRVASNEVYKDAEGKPQRRVEWHRVVAWGKTAENCGQYLKKGRQIIVQGRVQTRSWDDSDGKKRYTTETVANQVTFVGGAKEVGEAVHPAASSAGMEVPPDDKDMPGDVGGDDLPL